MIALRVGAWSAWAPGIEGAEAWQRWASAPELPRRGAAPSLPFVPPLLRRRCDELARGMLHVAEACCGARWRSEVSSVFGSRHGPIATTAELLEALAGGKPVSPSGFTHSVHNTQLGLFSIWAENTRSGSSIAAGPETFGNAFVEASTLLRREPGRPTLLVVGEEEIPESLAAAATEPNGHWAVAFLLENADDGEALGFEIVPRGDEGSGEPALRPLPDGLAFLRWWLMEEDRLQLAHGRRVWTWVRVRGSDGFRRPAP